MRAKADVCADYPAQAGQCKLSPAARWAMPVEYDSATAPGSSGFTDYKHYKPDQRGFQP
jgi:hypothetical protein